MSTDQLFLSAAAATVVSAALTYILTSFSIRVLKARSILVADYHKPSRPLVPRPAGPAVITSIIAAELILYAYTSHIGIAALIMTSLIGFLIGLIDDLRSLGGTVKPLLLAAAAAPIIILGTYDPHLSFPIFGSTRLTIVYPLLIIIAIPVTANTVNTLDVLNGVVSSFTAIAAIPLLVALILKSNFILAAAALPFIASSATFHLHHKYPSKIFPGDSGTLALGSFYGALAVIGGVEIAGVIALLPAILNSFFYLSSVRRFLEHRKVTRPTQLLADGRLEASRSPEAPITLVRILLLDRPKDEKEVALAIVRLTVLSALLAILTAFATWGILKA